MSSTDSEPTAESNPPTRMGRPRKVTIDDVVETVRRLTAAGECDLLEGGVPTKKIVDELPISQGRAEHRVREAAASGHIRTVRGACPETYRARKSYLPPEASR